MRATILVTTLLLAASPAVAQTGGLTIDQVKGRYRGMNEVHIQKCDFNGDGMIDQKEMHCVSGIYQQMYLDD